MSAPNTKILQILSLPVGIILLVLALVIEKYLPETRFFDFLAGFFLGLSAVFNIFYIIVAVKNMASYKK